MCVTWNVKFDSFDKNRHYKVDLPGQNLNIVYFFHSIDLPAVMAQY